MRSSEPSTTSAVVIRPSLPQGHIGRFLIVGIMCVALDLAVYLALVTSGLGRYPAKAGGFITGMILGFILNKTWTFRSRRAVSREAAIYFVLYAISLLTNVGLNGVVLKYGTPMFGHATTATAFILATIVCTIFNFLGMRYITFRHGIASRLPTVVRL